MKVYVAGKFEDTYIVNQVQSFLVDSGHTITCDWTTNESTTAITVAKQAGEDLAGVLEADAFVGLFIENFNYRGAYVELGAALGAGKRVFVVGSGSTCIFLYLPSVVRFATLEDFYRCFNTVELPCQT